MAHSQTGPLSSLPFTVLNQPYHEVRPAAFPCAPPSTLAPSPFHLTARQCRCGRPLNACGHHRSACAVAGVLGRRGHPLGDCCSHGLSGSRCSTPWSETWIFCLGHSLTTGGRRSALVQRGTTRHRHYSGVSPQTRWHSPKRARAHQWNRHHLREKEERTHLSRVFWRWGSCKIDGVGHGSEGADGPRRHDSSWSRWHRPSPEWHHLHCTDM